MRRPALVLLTAAAGLVAIACSHGSHPPPVLLRNGCSIFPADSIWNTPVRGLPLDPHSADYVRSIGPDLPLHADFNMPFAAGNNIPAVTQVVFPAGHKESDPGPYAIPDGAPVEPGGDAHVLVIDGDTCRLYELFAAKRLGIQRWSAESGAIFDLRSNRLRPAEWTSADAAGLPILPGLVRYDEVERGHIRHALRFTARVTRREFIWPARHCASTQTDANLPPMGQRFRLRASFDVRRFAAETRVILTALQDYGMFLADNGGPWFLTGAVDANWSMPMISELRSVKGSDFEAVDSSKLMVHPDSGEARQ